MKNEVQSWIEWQIKLGIKEIMAKQVQDEKLIRDLSL